MWDKLGRLETILTVIIGLITLGGAVLALNIHIFIQEQINNLINWAKTPIETPNVVFYSMVLFTIGVVGRLVYRVLSKRNIAISTPEATHVAVYKSYVLKFYIDSETKKPQVQLPIMCAQCLAKVDKLTQFPFDPRSVWITCSNGHESYKMGLLKGSTVESVLEGFYGNLIADFVHDWEIGNVPPESMKKLEATPANISA
jgi:hypothetical protein